MIDTHCHVHDKRFENDCGQAIARALESGITKMLTVGCDLADSQRAVAAAQRYGLAASVGIHPHEAKDAPDDVAGAVRALLPAAGDARVVAIGETGLDYYYEHSPRDGQARVVRAQIRLAHELGLPVIFHQRDAFDDFVAILRAEWMPQMRGVVHCFTGTAEQARTFVGEFGLLLGIGGVLTFPKTEPLHDAVRSAGAAALVLETDAPYLAPVPMRGKRNEPSFMKHTAAKLSELLEIPFEELERITDNNATNLFGL